MCFGDPDELAMLTFVISAVHRWETVVLEFLDLEFPRAQCRVGSPPPWYFHQFDEDAEDEDDDAYLESSKSSSSSDASSGLQSELDDDERAYVEEDTTGHFDKQVDPHEWVGPPITITRNDEHTTASTLQPTAPNLCSMKVHFGAPWPEIDMQLSRIANCAPALQEIHWKGHFRYVSPPTSGLSLIG